MQTNLKSADIESFEDEDGYDDAMSCLVDPQSVTVPETPFRILANEHGLYSVPEDFRKREVPKVLASGNVYEPGTLKFMQNMAGTGDIVSGGAFIGDFFPALSRALKPGSLIHSFEPNPVTWQSACHTIALNQLENIRLPLAAVGEFAGVLPLQVARSGNNPLAAGARLVKDPQGEFTIDVNVVPIDVLVPSDREISVLHLDIEGHEMPALLGASALIRRCKPIIILEGSRAPARRMYKRFMRNHFPDLDYQFAGVIEHNMIFVVGQS